MSSLNVYSFSVEANIFHVFLLEHATYEDKFLEFLQALVRDVEFLILCKLAAIFISFMIKFFFFLQFFVSNFIEEFLSTVLAKLKLKKTKAFV